MTGRGGRKDIYLKLGGGRRREAGGSSFVFLMDPQPWVREGGAEVAEGLFAVSSEG